MLQKKIAKKIFAWGIQVTCGCYGLVAAFVAEEWVPWWKLLSKVWQLWFSLKIVLDWHCKLLQAKFKQWFWNCSFFNFQKNLPIIIDSRATVELNPPFFLNFVRTFSLFVPFLFLWRNRSGQRPAAWESQGLLPLPFAPGRAPPVGGWGLRNDCRLGCWRLGGYQNLEGEGWRVGGWSTVFNLRLPVSINYRVAIICRLHTDFH